ncbi:MAG: hypothetical protein K2F83_00165 [Oscillospiraceae bacterium]|nr:hypothetical protein [Oscillospiraceae bacterium]
MTKTITGTQEDIRMGIDALLKETSLDKIISITFQTIGPNQYSATILYRTGK